MHDSTNRKMLTALIFSVAGGLYLHSYLHICKLRDEIISSDRTYLGIQLGDDFSTSQVANNFIETTFWLGPFGPLPLSAMFVINYKSSMRTYKIGKM